MGFTTTFALAALLNGLTHEPATISVMENCLVVDKKTDYYKIVDHGVIFLDKQSGSVVKLKGSNWLILPEKLK